MVNIKSKKLKKWDANEMKLYQQEDDKSFVVVYIQLVLPNCARCVSQDRGSKTLSYTNQACSIHLHYQIIHLDPEKDEHEQCDHCGMSFSNQVKK